MLIKISNVIDLSKKTNDYTKLQRTINEIPNILSQKTQFSYTSRRY